MLQWNFIPSIINISLFHECLIKVIFQLAFEKYRQFVKSFNLIVFWIIYNVNAFYINLYLILFFHIFTLRIKFSCLFVRFNWKNNTSRFKMIFTLWILSLWNNIILLKKIDRQLIIYPWLRLIIICIKDMPHKKFMFISNTNFDVQTQFAWVHRRPHFNSYSIEIVKLILY